LTRLSQRHKTERHRRREKTDDKAADKRVTPQSLTRTREDKRQSEKQGQKRLAFLNKTAILDKSRVINRESKSS